ncbi:MULTISPECIES: NrfD/PsrC family molybdoenzyme membrane anchor subunit [unclassified Brachybacterium]|uniref:NrfD/PsrC family molybdoenzyme membrane anchor subunit n=1 Tax=unclassified Brachybacterium TaxID=2623841 RepID=UPI000C7F82B9|nr:MULTISPECIES: NrfD/PsrC family molybdoenzyme membrane anchor subunit [unclassified Brachybacterium]PMC74376.1 molybdopterin oxidoreductase [Brachybacterium sp. UMB0905]
MSSAAPARSETTPAPSQEPTRSRSLLQRLRDDHRRRSDIAYADSTIPRSTINRRKLIWYVSLLVVIAATIVPTLLRLWHGLSRTDLTSQMPWGAWIALYIFFVGLSAGAFLLSSLVYVFGMHRFERIGRAALTSAIVCMGVALVFVGFDLGRWDRALSTLWHFEWTSPLSWEVRFYTIYIALLIAELTIALLVHRRKAKSPEKSHRWLKILGIIGLPLAIFGVHGGTGTIFAVVEARGMWFGGLFPVIFVLSAMVSGTALLTLVYYLQSKAVGRPVDTGLMAGLATVLSAVLAIDLGLTFYEFIVPLLANQHHDMNIISVQATGPFWWTFWIMQLGLGMIVPFILTITRLKHNPKIVAIASALVVLGIIAVRFNIVVPPLLPPIIDGYPWSDYLPTLSELAVCVCFVACGILAYSLFAEFQPIHEPDPDEAAHIGSGIEADRAADRTHATPHAAGTTAPAAAPAEGDQP